MLHAEQIAKDVWWVGGLDWNERLFHGYATEMGITYNAYLIMDEKITLIDTTKKPFASELIERISEIVDPSKIDIVIANHVEMDHSGSLPEIMKLAPNATIYASAPQGVNGLKAHYGEGYNYVGVKTGDSLNIGKRTLSFIQTPMVHWPDNMVTYDEMDKILFSNDAFGQHITTSKRFDGDNPYKLIMYQAKKYYANIVQPYAAQARKALEAVKTLDLKMIAPSHGVIWRDHIPDILEAYDVWTNREVKERCTIVYDSMWHSTEKMARAIASGTTQAGVEVHLYDLKENPQSDIMTMLMNSKYVFIGSPTYNSHMMPNVAGFLTYLKGLSPTNPQHCAMAFGSFGWAPLGPKEVHSALEDAKFEIMAGPETCNWLPSEEYLDDLENRITDLIKSHKTC